jgi:hypothetical protein
MGGDGGVVASNRKYMRGAGTADHTANSAKNATLDPALEREELVAQMHTCAVSGQPLQLGRSSSSSSSNDKNHPASSASTSTSTRSTVVCCPYGRLYYKEAVVEALLLRKKQNKDDDDHRIRHIRGLKDLHPVRFHFVDSVPFCPITGVELNGQVAAYVLVPGRVVIGGGGGGGDDNNDGEDKSAAYTPNVVSERAFKQLGEQALVEEYGPMEQKIRLIPPAVVLKDIQQEWEIKMEAEKSKKKSKSALKKRKRELETGVAAANNSDSNKEKDDARIKDSRRTGTSSSGAGGGGKQQMRTEAAVARVSAAVQTSTSSDRNTVLSSLFTTADAKISDKDKKDNLFARC